ncbi:AaceriAAL004Wp [[Ashbya] aceris (nom. inval.)]|nr:AaceriAAL004Wp [[Ashbya] aceris (nom. inval.)]
MGKLESRRNWYQQLIRRAMSNDATSPLSHVSAITGSVGWTIHERFKPVTMVIWLVHSIFLQPIYMTVNLFFWQPMMALQRAIWTLALFPANLLLKIFLRTSVQELAVGTDFRGALTIAKVCVQYVVATAVVGSFLGITTGVVLGSIHRMLRIPALYVTILPTYVDRTTEWVASVRELFSNIIDAGLRSIPILSSGVLVDESGDLFTDLLDTYEHEYVQYSQSNGKGLREPQSNSKDIREESEKVEFDDYGNMTPVSIQDEEDSGTSTLSAISNLWDSVPDSGTVRTDVDELKYNLKNSSRQKIAHTTQRYDKFDFSELHHRH